VEKIELPENLFQERDLLIESFVSGQEPAPPVNIYAWLESDGWDLLVGSSSNLDWGYNQFDITDHFNDDEFRSEYLNPTDAIKDDMRVEHSKMLVNNMIQNGNGYSFGTHELKNSNHQSVHLGYIIEMQGQLGPHTDWCGYFYSNQDFKDHLKNNGIWTYEEFGNLTDEEILKLWNTK
jgi:hypothetical protein